MRSVFMRWSWVAVLALATGCEGIDLEQLVEQHPALTRVVLVPPGADCAQGGRALQAGADVNHNGVLDDAEVTSTERVCATALVRKRPEPAGTNCAHGGQAVQTGVDLDASGQLDDAEVTATEYLCATLLPQVLVRVQAVPPGERCANGGQLSRAGHDTNGNGELEDSEVTREAYGCTEPEPVLTRVIARPSGACQGAGSVVEAGPDLDRDEVLDDGERRATIELCGDTSRVLVSRLPEPVGMACPSGGTRVRAGVDANDDGELSDQERIDVLVCNDVHTYHGNYQAQGAADLAALQGITRIRGGLRLTRTALTEAVLPSLVVVEGALNIDSNASLTRVELPSLRFVGQHVSVSSNPLLEVLVLGGGQQERLWVEQSLTVEHNPRLQSVSGLRYVAPRNALYLRDNDALQHHPLETGFGAMHTLTEGLIVAGNDALEHLPLSNLGQVGGFVFIERNPALRSLGGLSSLTTVGSDFYLTGNDALRDLSGPAMLRAVGGWLRISGNNGLLTTEGLTSLGRVGGMTLIANASLEAAGDLPLLETIESQLEVSSNPKLVTVRNLNGLRNLTNIALSDNPLLTRLPGLGGVRHMNELLVSRNATLASLEDLTGLRSLRRLSVSDNPGLVRLSLGALEQVTLDFIITSNPRLPTCLATALASVYTGEPDWLVIRDNDDAATCGN
jgi:hypothetical protein